MSFQNKYFNPFAPLNEKEELEKLEAFEKQINELLADRVGVKFLSDKAVMPKRADSGSAGWDLYAVKAVKNGRMVPMAIYPGETKMFSTGISLDIPKGYVGYVFPRSGLSTNNGIRLANCVGVVDESYKGEVFVALHNDSSKTYIVNEGDRIAQIVFMHVPNVVLEETETLSESERGTGGFGHSGK